MNRRETRRIAVNEIQTGDAVLPQSIIEIAGGVVVRHYPLTEEQPHTEWLGGTVEIRTGSDGRQRVYKNENLIE